MLYKIISFIAITRDLLFFYTFKLYEIYEIHVCVVQKCYLHEQRVARQQTPDEKNALVYKSTGSKIGVSGAITFNIIQYYSVHQKTCASGISKLPNIKPCMVHLG